MVAEEATLENWGCVSGVELAAVGDGWWVLYAGLVRADDGCRVLNTESLTVDG